MLPTVLSLDLPLMWGPSCPPPKNRQISEKSFFFFLVCAGNQRFPSLPALSSLLQKAERLLKKYHCSYSLTAAASALQSQRPRGKLQALFQGVCSVPRTKHPSSPQYPRAGGCTNSGASPPPQNLPWGCQAWLHTSLPLSPRLPVGPPEPGGGSKKPPCCQIPRPESRRLLPHLSNQPSLNNQASTDHNLETADL